VRLADLENFPAKNLRKFTKNQKIKKGHNSTQPPAYASSLLPFASEPSGTNKPLDTLEKNAQNPRTLPINNCTNMLKKQRQKQLHRATQTQAA
jgi:hypothetical protein